MATLEERKKRIEAEATAKLEAIAAEETRRAEVAEIDRQVALLKAQVAELHEQMQPLLAKRDALTPKRPRKPKEVGA